MSHQISITLVKSLIIESVKNETFQKGQFDRAVDPKAVTAAYHEQAGDEQYHLRILDRALYTNLSELKTILSEYVSPYGGMTADNIYSRENDDFIVISLSVSERFNNGMMEPLAKLCSKYVEESMLMDWWKPINDKQASLYAQFVERDLAAI